MLCVRRSGSGMRRGRKDRRKEVWSRRIWDSLSRHMEMAARCSRTVGGSLDVVVLQLRPAHSRVARERAPCGLVR